MKNTDSELKEKLFDNKLLWRHRSDNSKNNYSLDELENGYIYFSKPEELNDPYDCSFGLLKAKIRRKEQIKYFQTKNQGINRSERRAQAKKIVKENGSKIFENADKKILENIGVASFTINCGNLMMWSHYSNFHKGICLGFNKQIDEDYFASFPINYIEYPEEYKPYEYDSTDKDEYMRAMKHLVETKTFLWKNENEFRIIRQNYGKENFQKKSLEFVVLGIEINPDFQKKVLEAISKNGNYCNLRILKMTPSKENIFGLDFKEIYSR
jgi:hypothetical protein